MFRMAFLFAAIGLVGCASLKPLKVVELPGAVNESSGLACVGENIFTINDSQNSTVLFQVDTNGLVEDSVLINATNMDWEELCDDGSSLFICDVGNNLQTRRDQKIYVVEVSKIQNDFHQSGQVVETDSILFTLPDQPNNFQKRNRNFDIEAAFVKNDFIYFISKNAKASGRSYGKLYRVSNSIGQHEAQLLDSFQFNEPITAADYDDVANRLVVTGYLSCFVFDDFDETFLQSTPPRRYRYNKLRQYEGIAFSEDQKRVYISNEKGLTRKAALFQVPIDRLTIDKRLGGGPGFWWRRFKLTLTLCVYNNRIKRLTKQ